MPNEALYKTQSEDRAKHTALIIESSARNKVIIAGAGTGKSFTFKELLSTKSGDNLALTFINSLARDLQKDLDGLADSYTFHGYCKKLLHSISVEGINSHFYYFPKLPKIIEADATIMGNGLGRFEEAFHTLCEDARIDFYLERGNYYNAVGHGDAVYRVLKYFQSGVTSLPSFCQVVVDEYQDFNRLEVTFIEELAKNSPVLIAGDDDQAIYNFKNASADYIRSKSHSSDFEKFELPYCSRCTEVIVDAVHDITSKAQTLGKLSGRIEKNYTCFLPDKEADSIANPQIIFASCSTHTTRAPYISKFIELEVVKIPQAEIDNAREKNYPCVLILGPSHYTKQIYTYLKPKFTNIDYPEAPDKDIYILEGYKILMRDENSNLGWRIILECSHLKEKVSIIKTSQDGKKQLIELLPDNFKKSHLDIVKLLQKIKEGAVLSQAETQDVIEKCEHTIDEIKKLLDIELGDEAELPVQDNSVSIKITTINGSKGLSANYVFLVGMNDGDFPRIEQNPTDNEICQFIVGLTRTRKKCYLISNSRFGLVYGKAKSVFIDWIKLTRSKHIIVNAEYFK